MVEINIGTKILSPDETLNTIETLDITSIRRPAKKNILWAYTDGSVSGDELAYASSAMIISKNRLPKIIVETRPAVKNTSSISAEINGVTLAIKEAFAQGFDQLVIFHDTEILDPEFVTTKTLSNQKHPTYSYFKQLNALAKNMNVIFAKVKGHENSCNKIVDLVVRKNSNLLSKQMRQLELISASKISESIKPKTENFIKGACAPKTAFYVKNQLRSTINIYAKLGELFNSIRIPNTNNIPNEYVTNSLRLYMHLFDIEPNEIKFKYNTEANYVKHEDTKRVLKKIYNLTKQRGAI